VTGLQDGHDLKNMPIMKNLLIVTLRLTGARVRDQLVTGLQDEYDLKNMPIMKIGARVVINGDRTTG
jgi:hypothetical protein